MNLTGMDREYTSATVEPSQSVEGYWTVVRGGEVLLITRDLEEANAACRKIQDSEMRSASGGEGGEVLSPIRESRVGAH